MTPVANISGNTTYSATINGLTNGTTYDFVVTAVDSVKGESSYAYKVSVTPGSSTATPDTTPPVITLIGNNPLTVVLGATYTDPGSSVTDNVDSGLIATVTGAVNTAVVGSYTLTYNASDAAGNAAVAVTRTVSVVAQPVSNDSDNDGLPDTWEQQYFGNLTATDGSGDGDGDGLSDIGEYTAGTAPDNSDSDGDGDSDGNEVQYGSDPHPQRQHLGRCTTGQTDPATIGSG